MNFIRNIAFITLAYAANIGCPIFDSGGNLFLFSAASDYSLSPDFTTKTGLLSSQNRPPFVSNNLVCIPSYNLNAVFFLNADPAHPEILHSYYFGTKTWRNITTTGTRPDLSTVRAVMDYDTLVIYAFDATHTMRRLGNAAEENLKNAENPQFTISWQEASNNAVPFNAQGYLPTFGHAFFNLYFFNVPGTAPGQVWGWRIHYAEWGLAPQSVQSDFPNTPGKTTTFTFKYPEQNEHDGAPAHVVFVPDDLSGVWVVNSYINTTTKVQAPSAASTSNLTRYAASGTTLVQYTPDTGMVRTMDFTWLAQKQPNPGVKWIDSPVSADLAKDATKPGVVGPSGGVTGSGSTGAGTTGAGSAKNFASVASFDSITWLLGALMALV